MRIDRPEHYFTASLERLKQAWDLYREGSSYALAMYTAGVSVECMLRAFKMLRDPTFDEKHDLKRLFRASGMFNVDPTVMTSQGLSQTEAEAHFRELQIAVTDVCELWSNDYRFASEERLRTHFRYRKLDRGIKGDALKSLALTLIVAAQRFIDKGVFQWKSSRKSN